MTAIRNEGKLNKNTTLIDAELFELKGVMACYLIESGDKKILIDSGAKNSGAVIYRKLKKLGAWPVNKIIITHSHFDHTQGIIYLREKAEEERFNIEVMASEKGISFLKNQKYNSIFNYEDQKPFINIDDVIPLQDGEVIELSDDFRLTTIETPGHMKDDISIYDEQNKCLFVGDSIGAKFDEDFLICNANTSFWDNIAFHSSVEKLKTINFESLCFSHFGYITGDEAKSILDDVLFVFDKWREIFEDNADKLDDIPFLEKILWKKVYSRKSESFRSRASLSLQNSIRMAVIGYINTAK